MSSSEQESEKHGGTGTQPRSRQLVVVTALLLTALVISGSYLAFRTPSGASSTLSNCTTSNTPCQVTIAYLVAYTEGQYGDLYGLTSMASHERFSNPLILDHHYKNAKAYIIDRTESLLREAQVYSISDTIDNAIQTSDTTARVPAHIVMQTARVGTITQNISIPLVKENGTWLIDWSPGLVFSKLDDPAGDPYYRRQVVLTASTPPRGTIYDSQGDVLAEDETVYQIGVVPGRVTNEPSLLSKLSTQLDLTPSQIHSMYAGRPDKDFVPIRTITPMLYQKVAAAISSVPGVQVQQAMGRVYPYGEATAAITGYVAPITPAQLKADTSHYYDQGDLIGEAGIEAWGEQYLRPIKGGTLTINAVNSNGTIGRPVYTVASKPGAPGKSIYTTISINEQLAAMRSLMQKAKGHGGSAVALDPGTGDVLAMASTPTYDPNDFSLGFTPDALARYTALDQPSLNRATQGAYPIDSVFKVVTLAAALGNGIKPTDTYACSSSYQVPGETGARQDPDSTCTGDLTLPEALASSSDVIFWEVGVQLNNKDQSILSNTAKAFGYGSPTGIIGLPAAEEDPGFVPTPQNVEQEGQSWTPGMAADLASGQGEFRATPLQMAQVAAALGNGGKRMQPILVSRVSSSNGKSVAQFKPRQVGTLPLTASNLAIVQSAIVAATDTPTSASYGAFHSFPVQVAGDTGTAPSGQPNPHALSTTYAPAPATPTQPVQPQIATAVVIEDVGTGNSYAAPVSLAMLSTYFNVT